MSVEFVGKALEYLDEPLKVLDMCGGLYICPKKDGKRLGPLVAYRGTDEAGLRYVGDLYADWAAVEAYPAIVLALAQRLLRKLPRLDIDTFCGAPEGGKHLADKLALHQSARYCYPEKKVKGLAWRRHGVIPGDHVVIVEDVTNNFSTTEQLITLISKAGGIPLAIATYLNRSETVEDVYTSQSGLELPVIALVREPYPEYRQDDPAVAVDVKEGNVVWSVKDKDAWSRMMEAMEGT